MTGMTGTMEEGLTEEKHDDHDNHDDHDDHDNHNHHERTDGVTCLGRR